MNDHKKRTAEMIAVMQAYVDGKEIEVSYDGAPFKTVDVPLWNWDYREYRIATIPDSINWDHVAPEWKWMARDEDGSVYFYTKEPSRREYENWFRRVSGSVITDVIGFASYTRGTVDWKDSLVRRPE